MAKEQARRLKHTGKGKPHSHIQIPHYILKSDAFGELSGNAVKLLLELAKEFKGHNNGDMSCAFSVLKRRGWRSSGTLAGAKHELLTKGWIICTRNGGSHCCALYALTWWPLGECPGKFTMFKAERCARNDWQKTELAVAIRTEAVAIRTEAPRKGS
jgi:hypothetical protein